MRVILVNANLIRVPPIGPYALDVLGTALEDAGHDVAVCDLARAQTHDDALRSIDASLSAVRPDAVAVSLRNTSDLFFPSFHDAPNRGSFIQSHEEVIKRIGQQFDSQRIIIGGAGFSSNPHQLLKRLGGTRGVQGPGEYALPMLLSRLRTEAFQTDPIVIDARGDAPYPRVRRTYVDNAWYYEHGGLGCIRTSIGCPRRCAYCVEPSSSGHRIRRRSVDDIMQEIDELVCLGVYDIHTADSEFNIPLSHAKRVLRAIADRRYPQHVRFWLYCQPVPFDRELAELMRQAHVAGINFGTDHTDADVLRSFGKAYGQKDVARTTALCNDHGIAVAHGLLFGSQADTIDKMFRTIDDIWHMKPRVIGALIGLAVLPHTRLARIFEQQTDPATVGYTMEQHGQPYIDPVFYVNPLFKIPDVYGWLRAHVGERIHSIMLPSPRSTNAETAQIVSSERVARQIASGLKGAYWYHYPDLPH